MEVPEKFSSTSTMGSCSSEVTRTLSSQQTRQARWTPLFTVFWNLGADRNRFLMLMRFFCSGESVLLASVTKG
jgi:hypothetical protein